MSSTFLKELFMATKRRKPGPKPTAEPARVVPLWLADSLVDALEAYADQHGQTRNAAAVELLRLALANDSSGYNPQTGSY